MFNASRQAMPGQWIAAGDHRMHLQALGEGSPAVILDAGQAGCSLEWRHVLPEVARFTRVCAYDRAGLGWSESGPLPRTPDRIVGELHTLLTHAGIYPPYLLAAHSLGGRYARLFAARYPDEVAGLVLVDHDQEFYGAALGAEPYRRYVAMRSRQYRMIGSLLGQLARTGLLRLIGGALIARVRPELRAEPADVRRCLADLAARRGAMRTTVDEYEQAVAAEDDLRAARLRPDLPLTVIAHGVPWPYPEYERAWQDGLRRVAALSSGGKVIVADRSTHAGILFVQPGCIVDAIREIASSGPGLPPGRIQPAPRPPPGRGRV